MKVNPGFILWTTACYAPCMSRGSRIVAIGGEGEQPESAPTVSASAAEPEAAFLDDWDSGEADAEPAPRRGQWLAPALAVMAVIGWTGFFAWTRQDLLIAGPTPAQWAELAGAWSGPAMLIGIGWLIAMRHSRREAARFGDTARLLASESERLEQRLLATNRELSLAREFIAAQGRDLEALGRVAVERLTQNAERLQSLIHDNGAQVEALGTVSAAALDNMERLRGQLPVIASSAKDVTNNIGNAGRTAHAQLQELIAGFKRLNEFGQASERQVLALKGQVGDILDEYTRQTDAFDSLANQRFAALAERGEAFRGQLDQHEVDALAAVRNRAGALAEELEETRRRLDEQEAESLTSLRARLGSIRDESATIGRSLREIEDSAASAWQAQLVRMREQFHETLESLGKADADAMAAARARMQALMDEAQRFDANLAERNRRFDEQSARRRDDAAAADAAALARMQEQLAALDAELSARQEAYGRSAGELAATAGAIAEQLATFEARLAEIAHHGSEAEAHIGASLQTLADKLLASRVALEGTDRQVDSLTDASVRLLELIQASVQHSRKDLPEAIASSDTRLADVEGRVFALRDAAAAAGRHGEELAAHIRAGNAALDDAREKADSLHDELERRQTAHARVLEDLNASLSALARESEGLAAHARSELTEAIAQLSGAARDAVAGIEQLGDEKVMALAARLGSESAAAIDKAMRLRAAEVAGELEQAAAHAAGVSREAAMQLRDQLAKVNELAGNLERRVAHARERAEEQVDNDFARRMALITDSLNSHAIDIARALSADVSDTAWAAYLRGDRGIFTRRAVSLLDSGEARAISQVYESDRDFHDHVSRYIHDFEAMLRQLLSTRDGHALGVTILSSDMGKLYVALAQAIERLRS
jgi:hypothetical protein